MLLSKYRHDLVILSHVHAVVNNNNNNNNVAPGSNAIIINNNNNNNNCGGGEFFPILLWIPNIPLILPRPSCYHHGNGDE
jgi:hypothetical protein